MTNEIQAIINKNLPAEVGTLLQERLKAGDEAIAQNDGLKSQVKRYEAEIQDYKRILTDQNDFNNQKKKLADDQEKLRVETANLDLKIALKELEYVKQSNNEIKDLSRIVFKNPTLTYGNSWNNNSNDYTKNTHGSNTTIVTTEK